MARSPVQNNAGERKRRFDALVAVYAQDLYRFGLWLCRDPALTDDLVQETYLRAWKSLDRLKDADAAKGWLLTILRREFYRTFERKVPDFVDHEELPLEADVDGPGADTELKRIREAILTLDAKYADPLLLQVIGGFSCEEIAEQLGQSKSAVMTQLFRARNQLKTALKVDDELTDNVHELS